MLTHFSLIAEYGIERAIRQNVETFTPVYPDDEIDPIVLQKRIADLEAQIRQLKGLT